MNRNWSWALSASGIEKRCWKGNIPSAISAMDLVAVTMFGIAEAVGSTTKIT